MENARNGGKIILLTGINGISAVLLIFLLSPGLIDIFSKPPIVMLCGLLLGFAAVLGCIILDYKILFAKQRIGKPVKIIANDADRPQAYIRMLKECFDTELFKKDINAGIDQIERFEKKRETIHLLLQTGENINAEKCLSIMNQITNIFYDNVRALATRASIFDEDEYELYRENRLELATEQAKREKGEFYASMACYVDEITDQNEEIILQIDKLTLELTRAGTAHKGDTDTILAMQKLDDYIQSTKLTQNLEREVGETVCREIKSKKHCFARRYCGGACNCGNSWGVHD